MATAGGSARRRYEALVETVDNEIRTLHGRFVTERDNLVVLLARATRVCRTVVALAPPDGSSFPRRRAPAARIPLHALGRRRR
jgi:hypothetical protein